MENIEIDTNIDNKGHPVTVTVTHDRIQRGFIQQKIKTEVEKFIILFIFLLKAIISGSI